MKTSSFFKFDGEGGISIARYRPKGFQRLPSYPELAPGPWFRTKNQAEYTLLYERILAALDPKEVWWQLHQFSNRLEPVLLCWEPPGKFCHRRLVAKWFAQKLGEIVVEHKTCLA